jgi:hypothetical protein
MLAEIPEPQKFSSHRVYVARKSQQCFVLGTRKRLFQGDNLVSSADWRRFAVHRAPYIITIGTPAAH